MRERDKIVAAIAAMPKLLGAVRARAESYGNLCEIIPPTGPTGDLHEQLFQESAERWRAEDRELREHSETLARFAAARGIDEAVLFARIARGETHTTGAEELRGLLDAVQLALLVGDSAPDRTRRDDDEGFLSANEIATRLGVSPDMAETRLRRYRNKTNEGWIENESASAREPRFLYRLSVARKVFRVSE